MATTIPYNGKWRTVIRRTGYPTRTKVTDSHEDGQKWARSIEVEMDVKTYVVPSGERSRKIFQKFSDEVSEKRPGKKWEQVRIAKFIREIKWMHKVIEDVDRFDIQAWRDDRLKEISESSVRRELNLISSVFSHAMQEWGVAIRVNPVHEVKRPPEAKHRTRRFTESDSKILNEAFKFDENVPPRKGLGAVKDSVMWAIHISVETALRSGELFALEWKDVHLDDAWLHVWESKNGDERDVPLTERAEELFRKLGPGEGRVFPINPGSAEATWRLIRNKAGLKDLRRQDMRHEAASTLAKSLTNLELSKTLGHRDPRTVMIYYNPTPAELAKKLRKKI